MFEISRDSQLRRIQPVNNSLTSDINSFTKFYLKYRDVWWTTQVFHWVPGSMSIFKLFKRHRNRKQKEWKRGRMREWVSNCVCYFTPQMYSAFCTNTLYIYIYIHKMYSGMNRIWISHRYSGCSSAWAITGCLPQYALISRWYREQNQFSYPGTSIWDVDVSSRNRPYAQH